MKRWIKILIIIPVMLMLSQCVHGYGPYNSNFVEGIVFDASDGYVMSSVYVELRRAPRDSSWGRYYLNGGERVVARPYPRHETMVAGARTDFDGFFKCEFSWYNNYSYWLLFSAEDYNSARVPVNYPTEQYVRITLYPH